LFLLLLVGVYAVRQQPYQIFPGDSFSTSFFFESDEKAIFGPASVDEMCNSVLLYYPAKQLLGVAPWICIYNLAIGACNASLSTSAVELTDSRSTVTSQVSNGATSFSTSDAYLERTFGYNTNGQCFEKNQSDTDGESSTSIASSIGRSPLQTFSICALAIFVWFN
jgi:Copper type II ascorbate-dependent monooxygenase, C-terminal domain